MSNQRSSPGNTPRPESPATRTPDPDSCEERLDEAVEETFPASDPPAASPGGDIVQPADREPQRR